MRPDVAILCGGKGTRMRHILGDMPKALAPIGDKLMIERLIEYLQHHGFQRFILCAGYGADAIRAWLESWKGGGEIVLSVEDEQRGESAAIENANKHFRTPLVVIANGDTLLDGNISVLPFDVYRPASFCVGGIPSGIRTAILYSFQTQPPAGYPMIDVSHIMSFIDIGTPEGYARALEKYA